ncbi:MAG TPA: hypothetical protein VIK91_07320 [Nannocystis sp.]
MQAAERRFPDLAVIRADPRHSRRQEAQDVLNYATLVRLADDFHDWLREYWLEDGPEASSTDAL